MQKAPQVGFLGFCVGVAVGGAAVLAAGFGFGWFTLRGGQPLPAIGPSPSNNYVGLAVAFSQNIQQMRILYSKHGQASSSHSSDDEVGGAIT